MFSWNAPCIQALVGFRRADYDRLGVELKRLMVRPPEFSLFPAQNFELPEGQDDFLNATTSGSSDRKNIIPDSTIEEA